MFFENILPVLKQHVNVHVIWLVYQHEQINKLKKISTDFTIIDFHDYDNAVKLLQKQKPDIIFADASRAFIDYALSTAAKFVGIPTFSMFWSDWYYFPISNKTKYVILNLSRFFSGSIPTDKNQNQNWPMRRGRFFMSKYFFLAKTQRAVKMNLFKIIQNFFMLFTQSLFNTPIDSRFSTTLHFLEDGKLQKSLIKSGFQKSTLIVTGNPIFDEPLKKMMNKKIPLEKIQKKPENK